MCDWEVMWIRDGKYQIFFLGFSQASLFIVLSVALLTTKRLFYCERECLVLSRRLLILVIKIKKTPINLTEKRHFRNNAIFDGHKGFPKTESSSRGLISNCSSYYFVSQHSTNWWRAVTFIVTFLVPSNVYKKKKKRKNRLKAEQTLGLDY